MKLGTKIAVGILLGFGVPIVLVCLIEGINPHTNPNDREGLIASLFIFGLPPTALGSWLIVSSRRKLRVQERDRLRASFFQSLQHNKGHVTVLRFSMETGLDGKAAKAYLDERAQEFNAAYNVTEEGNLSYYFNLDGKKESESA